MMEDVKRETNEEPTAERETPPQEAGAEWKSCIDRLQRLQAEFENYKKRIARENGSLADRIADQVVLEFLAPYDNLERAVRSYARDRNEEAFAAGVEQILAQFTQVLERYAVERIPSVGTPFDPALHEALLSVPSEEKKNTIIDESSPGYRRNERVLRASKVTVSQGPAVQEE